MTKPLTTPNPADLPIHPDRFNEIYSQPLSMTMGEFVILMRLAAERLRSMGAQNVRYD